MKPILETIKIVSSTNIENDKTLPGPFTQLVWGATQKFGCGKARNSNGKVLARNTAKFELL